MFNCVPLGNSMLFPSISKQSYSQETLLSLSDLVETNFFGEARDYFSCEPRVGKIEDAEGTLEKSIYPFNYFCSHGSQKIPEVWRSAPISFNIFLTNGVGHGEIVSSHGEQWSGSLRSDAAIVCRNAVSFRSSKASSVTLITLVPSFIRKSKCLKSSIKNIEEIGNIPPVLGVSDRYPQKINQARRLELGDV